MKISAIFGAVLLLAALSSRTMAQELALGPGSRIWLEGTSTLHPFSCMAASVDFAMSFAKGAGDLSADFAAQSPATLSLSIPVNGLKSEHTGLDHNLQKALMADKFPDITFTMTGYQAKPAAGGYKITAQGQLSIAGIQKPETIAADESLAKGIAAIDGQKPILMSDFGVKPPTLMFGTIKVGDRIVVKFHLELKTSHKGESK